jgi:hypothetical protein
MRRSATVIASGVRTRGWPIHEHEPSTRPQHAVDGRERGGQIGDVHQTTLAIDTVGPVVGNGGEWMSSTS